MTNYAVSFVKSTTCPIEDEAFYQSMMKSGRKINSIELIHGIVDKSKTPRHRIDRLKEIVDQFSVNIKTLEAKNVPLPWNFSSILNQMKNLEKVSFINITNSGNEAFKKIPLELQQLREVKTSNVPNNFLNIFHELPTGVLHKIDLGTKQEQKTFTVDQYLDKKFCADCRIEGRIVVRDANAARGNLRAGNATRSSCKCRNISKNLFLNQINIKEVAVHNTMLINLDWKQLKLDSLSINGWTGIRAAIKHQTDLKSLSVNRKIHYDDFHLICSTLNSLEFLNIWTEDILHQNYKQISNLKNLKKAQIFLSLSETPAISFIQSSSLVDLELNCFNAKPSTESIYLLGQNCPNLKSFKLTSNISFHYLNRIVESFPNLDSLSLIFDSRTAYVYQFGVQHDNLKKLFIQSAYSDPEQLPMLLEKCKKIEEFSTSLTVSNWFIEKLLQMKPNLKALIFTTPYTDFTSRKVNKNFVSTLKKFGNNLNEFQFNQFRFEDQITPQILRQEFKDQFKTINFVGESLTGCKEWTMIRN